MTTVFDAQNISPICKRLSGAMDQKISSQLAQDLVRFFCKYQHTSNVNKTDVPALIEIAFSKDIEDLISSLSSGTFSWNLFLKLRLHFLKPHPELYTTLLLVWLTQPSFSLLWDRLIESKNLNEEIIKLLHRFENPEGLHTLVNYWNYLREVEGSTSDDIDGFLSTHKFI